MITDLLTNCQTQKKNFKGSNQVLKAAVFKIQNFCFQAVNTGLFKSVKKQANINSCTF